MNKWEGVSSEWVWVTERGGGSPYLHFGHWMGGGGSPVDFKKGLSIFGNGYVPCHYLLKLYISYVAKTQHGPHFPAMQAAILFSWPHKFRYLESSEIGREQTLQ